MDQNAQVRMVMNSTTKKKAMSGATITAGMVTSRYANPEPQLEVRMPKGTSFRRLHAALHLLAAEVELATAAGEAWIIQTDATSDERGRLYLELAEATEAEAKRGLALLQQVRG
jgi:Ser-tRNA(Ala) deacylase AlaX